MNMDTEQPQFDIIRVLLVILLASIVSTILLVSFTDADTPFDSIEYGISANITEPPPDCPHAMLISPINNSIVNTRDPTLTVYVYDNDDTIWFLTTTFYDYSTNNSISTLTSRTEYNLSTTWANRTPGETYRWYAFVDNSTGNYTSGIFIFTVSQDIQGTASDFWGTWILFAIILILFTLAIVFHSVILGVASMITSLIVTVNYANNIMATGSIFDDTMLYIFIFITMATFLDVVYMIFYRSGK